MATSCSGGRSRRELPTMGKQLVNFISLAAASRMHLFCNIQSRARTHAVLVIGLYELLGNQLPNSLSHPDPANYQEDIANDKCKIGDETCTAFDHRCLWHGIATPFLTLCLHIYFQ